MKLYSENQKPFVYAVFSGQDETRAVAVLEKLNEDGVLFWYADNCSKKELRRIEAAYSCILFMSRGAKEDERVWRCLAYAARCNKKILCVYLESAELSPGKELLLNALQSLDKTAFSGEDAFFEKLRSAEVFSDMKITGAQKKFAKRRGIISVLAPVSLAAAVFLAVVLPLLVVPYIKATSGSLSQLQNFGEISLSELANRKSLYVVGDQSFDEWYFAFYEDAPNEVYVNGLDTTLPTGDISDISDLYLLKSATDIAFEANRVSDISPLYTITTLENLTLNCNPIKSIEGIEALQNLQDVTLVCTDIQDISPLFKIPSLKNISFEHTYVSSIEGIENLNSLEGLRTGNSNLTDISPLNGIDFSYINDTGGFSFEAKGSLIRDFSPLGRIPKFVEVSANSIPLESILPYLEGKEVHHFKIEGSDIQSISQLASIKYIDILFLSGSYDLTSLAGIEDHPTLQVVELMDCPGITDFTPLLALPKLEQLTVSENMRKTAEPQLAGADFEIFYREDGE